MLLLKGRIKIEKDTFYPNSKQGKGCAPVSPGSTGPVREAITATAFYDELFLKQWADALKSFKTIYWNVVICLQ